MRLLLLAIFPVLLFAQNENYSPKVQKYPKAGTARKYRIAKKKIKEGSYYIAADYLEDVVKAKPGKISRAFQLAELNRHLRDYVRAEQYYKMVLDKDPEKYPEANYYYALMLKQNGKYQEAKTKFQEFLKMKDAKDFPQLRSMAKTDIAGCDTALALLANPTKVKVNREQGVINKPIQDFAPKPLKNNRILYSSLKSDTAINIDLADYNYYTSIFTAEKQGNIWVNEAEFPSPPNDPKTHVCNAILSPDEKTIIFTKCDQTPLTVMLCNLYKSTKEGNGWSSPEEIKNLNKQGFSTTQPAWGKDKSGNTILYFASNRGKGGDFDIYFAKMNNDGSFDNPERLGNEINTAGDDLTPFYHENSKTFYFSSTGHPGFGGLDVFKTVGTPGNFGEVKNMGTPVNSGADDLYFALDEKGAKGFLVSNREGTNSQRGLTCCDDIWGIVIRGDVFLKAIYVKRDDPSQTPIAGIDASLYKVDGKNFEFLTNTITSGQPFVMPLQRGVSYKINGNKEGYWPSVDNFSVNEDEDRDTITKVFYIDPIIKKKIKIENVYFQFDKSNVITFYAAKIDSVLALLNQNPGWLVEVQGHTDSKGTDEYNEKLSKRRAEEVKKYLITKGLAKERIIVKAFGEKQPAVPNELPDGTDDPEGRARNRRVEFKLITDNVKDAPEIEVGGEVVPQVKTGPGFTKGYKK
ncbi:MAG: OmpA family protein [Chitinophagales bacterium]|nr:OmpA family protein [Chitinophagales bacterium]MDW8272681.1 OmpA family protein [Chitinophagales bacterium]